VSAALFTRPDGQPVIISKQGWVRIMPSLDHQKITTILLTSGGQQDVKESLEIVLQALEADLSK
jgi:hypothetical protein